MSAARVDDLRIALAVVREELERIDQEMAPLLRTGPRRGPKPTNVRRLLERRRELMRERDALEERLGSSRSPPGLARVEPVIESGRTVAIHVIDRNGRRRTWKQGEFDFGGGDA